MDIFDAVKMFGTFPSGLILGLCLGLVWEGARLLRLGRVLGFIIDLIWGLFWWGAMFLFSIGSEGQVRYFTAASVMLGTAAERLTLGKVLAWLEKWALLALRSTGALEFIHKSFVKTRGLFVTNAENENYGENSEKNS